MVRVLRRFIRVGCNAAVEILHLEFGCRPFSSWMRQRVLEFAFRLGRMPAERLPAQVAAARWPLRQGSKRPELHEHRLAAAERVTAVSVAASVPTTSCSYAMFKQQAATAVRRADLAAIHAALQTRGRKSTVARYLDILGGDLADGLFPATCQAYLRGRIGWDHQLKFLFRCGMARVGHRLCITGQAASPACSFCGAADETAAHFTMECPAFTDEYGDFVLGLLDLAGQDACAAWLQLPPPNQLCAVLGSY